MRDLLEKVKNGEISVERAEAEFNKRMGRSDAILEDKEPKAGSVAHYKRAPESMAVGGAIIALVILEIYYDILFVIGIVYGGDQQLLAFFLGMASIIVALIIVIYIAGFLPDVMIVKHRMKKVVPSKEINWWSFK